MSCCIICYVVRQQWQACVVCGDGSCVVILAACKLGSTATTGVATRTELFHTIVMMMLLQEQVDKAIIHDYSWAVNSADERWLSLIRAKLVHAQYENADHLARDVDKIRRCAEAYHGKRASKFRNPGQQLVHVASCTQLHVALLAVQSTRWHSAHVHHHHHISQFLVRIKSS